MDLIIFVIIPVYNAESYLRQAFASLQKQTYKHWHCVLVDDASNDDSFVICKDLESDARNVSSIHLDTNAGPAHARNVGIEYAISHGADYLAFMDADDYLECDYLEQMVLSATSHKADIVWCNICEIYPDSITKKIHVSHDLPDNEIVPMEVLLSSFFEDRKGLGSMCNKLYSATFVKNNQLKVNEKRFRAEDWEFNLMAFQKKPIVVAIKSSLYDYVHYPSPSIMGRYRERDYDLFWRSREQLIQMAKDFSIKYDNVQFDGIFFYSVLNHLQQLKGVSFAETLKRLRFIMSDLRLTDLIRKNSYKNLQLPKTYMIYFWLLKWKMNGLLGVLIHLR